VTLKTWFFWIFSRAPNILIPRNPPPHCLHPTLSGPKHTIVMHTTISIFLACYHVAKNEKNVLLWGSLFVWLLFGRTCWTCLDPPLPTRQSPRTLSETQVALIYCTVAGVVAFSSYRARVAGSKWSVGRASDSMQWLGSIVQSVSWCRVRRRWRRQRRIIQRRQHSLWRRTTYRTVVGLPRNCAVNARIHPRTDNPHQFTLSLTQNFLRGCVSGGWIPPFNRVQYTLVGGVSQW